MRKLLKLIQPRSAIAKSVGVLVGGTAGAQIIMLISTPLLTRLYSPEDFGLLAIFAAMLGILSVVASGRYELAIPLPEKDEDAGSLMLLSLFITGCFSITTGLTLLTFSEEIASAINAPQIKAYIWLIPFGVLFAGVYQVSNQWAVRSKKFGYIASTRIWQAASTSAIQLGGYKLGAVFLIGGQAFGQGVGSFKLMMLAKSSGVFRMKPMREIKAQAKRYINFPVYSTWTGLLNAASLQMAPLAFIGFYGASVAGLYALTLRILSLPIGLIGSAIGSVFTSYAPAALRRGNIHNLIEKLHFRLALAGSLPLAFLVYFGPASFSVVFGDEWKKAGEYARWMAPWIYLQLQWSPLSTLSTILEMQKTALICQATSFFLRFGTLALVYILGADADTAIQCFAVVSAVVYFAMMNWFFGAAGVNVLKTMLTDISFILLALVLLLPIKLAVEYWF